MSTKHELFANLNMLDMDDFNVVQKVADAYIEWCEWNKSYETIEVYNSKKFESIIVIHSFYDTLQAEDGWEFLSDIKGLLNHYSLYSEEDCLNMCKFWFNKLNGILN